MKSTYKIVSFVLVLFLFLSSMCSVCAYTYNPFEHESQKYKLEFVLAYGSNEEACDHYQYINMLEYNADGSATSDESTPDYILAFFNVVCSFVSCTEVIGDYVVVSANDYVPYDIALYVFSTKDNTVYTLKEAWDAQLPRIEEILNLVGDRIGDVNYDDVINIKDATLIQKEIAELEKTRVSIYISDFDRDGERTIKDATAIQKYIAGLEVEIYDSVV